MKEGNGSGGMKQGRKMGINGREGGEHERWYPTTPPFPPPKQERGNVQGILMPLRTA